MKRTRRSSFRFAAAALSSVGAMALGCSDGSAERPAPALAASDGAVGTRFVDVDEATPSEEAAGGRWQTRLHYPQISGAKAEVVQAVNGAIERKVSEVRGGCEGAGDVEFQAKVTLESAELVSFSYEGAYLCSGMPHPAPFAGGMSFDLRTGAAIDLAAELRPDADLRAALEKRVAEAARSQLGEEAEACEPKDLAGFFLTLKGVTFVDLFASDAALCGAEVELSSDEVRPYLRDGSVLRQDK